MIKKHQRKSQQHPNGAIIDREGPIHVSNVKIVEKATNDKKAKKAA
jgi:large subunit ribosomal protein L24